MTDFAGQLKNTESWVASLEQQDEASLSQQSQTIRSKFRSMIKFEVSLKRSDTSNKDELLKKCQFVVKRILTLREVACGNKPYSVIEENLQKLTQAQAKAEDTESKSSEKKEEKKEVKKARKVSDEGGDETPATKGFCVDGSECTNMKPKHHFDYIHLNHPQSIQLKSEYFAILKKRRQKQKLQRFLRKQGIVPNTSSSSSNSNGTETDAKTESNSQSPALQKSDRLKNKYNELRAAGMSDDEIAEQLDAMMKLEEDSKKKVSRSERHAARRSRLSPMATDDNVHDSDSDEDFDVGSCKRHYSRRRQNRRRSEEEAEPELTEEQKQQRLEQLLKKTQNFMRTITMRIRRNYKKSGGPNQANDAILSTHEVRAFLQNNTSADGANNNNNNNNSSSSSNNNSSHNGSDGMDQEAIEQTQSLVGGTLKDYQKIGLRWMVSLNKLRLNGILADEMGLGKTVQVVALLAYLLDIFKVRGPHLVVAPLSTLDGWMCHLEQWCPKLKAYKHHGEDRRRNFEAILEGEQECDVVVTSFDVAIRDGLDFLARQKWCYLVLDEAHRIKNSSSRLFTVLNALSTRHRLLLTGTPLQNNLTELWSLLNFILPEVFDSAQSFESWFCTPFGTSKGKKNGNGGATLKMTDEERILVIERLHRAIDPFLLRRNKADVLPNLAKKEEVVLKIPLSGVQMAIYQQLTQHRGIYYKPNQTTANISHTSNNPNNSNTSNSSNNSNSSSSSSAVSGSEGSGASGSSDIEDDEKRFRIDWKNNVLMELRKVCSHPMLLARQVYDLTEENIISASGKLWLLDHLIPKLLRFDHRILIFCQFVSCMDVLAEYLEFRDLRYQRIDGSTSSEDRIAALNQFNSSGASGSGSASNSNSSSSSSNTSSSSSGNGSDAEEDASGEKAEKSGKADIFLMSTRACGTGINAQTADTVILFDSDWNPQMDVQAQARAHRIGQTREVRVFRLITEQSVEEMVLDRAQNKLDLEKKAIEGGKFDFSTSQDERKAFLEEICKQRIESNQAYFTVATGAENKRKINKMIARTAQEEEMFNKMDQMSDKMHQMQQTQQKRKKDAMDVVEDMEDVEQKGGEEGLDWAFGELTTLVRLPAWLDDVSKILEEKKALEMARMQSGTRRRRKRKENDAGKNDENSKFLEELDKDLEEEDARNKKKKKRKSGKKTKNNVKVDATDSRDTSADKENKSNKKTRGRKRKFSEFMEDDGNSSDKEAKNASNGIDAENEETEMSKNKNGRGLQKSKSGKRGNFVDIDVVNDDTRKEVEKKSVEEEEVAPRRTKRRKISKK